MLGGSSSSRAPRAPAPAAKLVPFSEERLVLIKPLTAAITEEPQGLPGCLMPQGSQCFNVRAREHPSVSLRGLLQFWITVPPNRHSGLVIHLGEGPKSPSDFKESQYGKVRD